MAKARSGRNVAMMIRKGVVFAAQAERFQRPKKALRMANTGQSVKRPTAQQVLGRSDLPGNIQAIELAGFETHREAWRHRRQAGFRQAIANDGIGCRQPRNRLTQWPDRQPPAIARPTGVKDNKLDITSQGVMLQTVIAEHDIHFRMGGQQGRTSGRPLTSNPDGNPAAAGRAAEVHRRPPPVVILQKPP